MRLGRKANIGLINNIVPSFRRNQTAELFQSHTNVDNINMQDLSIPRNHGDRNNDLNEGTDINVGETSWLQFMRKF